MHCVLDDLHAELDANPQRVRLRFVHRNNGATPAMFTYATYFIIVYGLTCWLIGRRIPLLHASFRCDTPPADHEYPSMFCDDMRFNAIRMSISIPNSRRCRSCRTRRR